MLKDSEILALRNNEEYKRLTELKLENIVTDLIKSNHTDFKPDISVLIKAFYKFLKARRIRYELILCSRDFLERILNYELKWECSPQAVQKVCESDTENFFWMRYDEPRVKALFNRSISLITQAEFRHLIKSTSTVAFDKDERLQEIRKEIEELLKETIRSIRTKSIYKGIVEFGSDEFYEMNEKRIQEEFLGKARSGALGSIPKQLNEGEADE